MAVKNIKSRIDNRIMDQNIKVSSDLTNSFDSNLIKYIKKQPYILLKKNELNSETWSRIAKDLSTTGEIVRNRWEELVQEFESIKCKNEPDVSNWQHYKDMEYLNSYSEWNRDAKEYAFNINLIDNIAKYPELCNEDLNEGFVQQIGINSDNLWKTIAEELNSSVKSCKKEWLKLKRSFEISYKRTLAGKSSSKLFPYYNMLLFLVPYIEAKWAKLSDRHLDFDDNVKYSILEDQNNSLDSNKTDDFVASKNFGPKYGEIYIKNQNAVFLCTFCESNYSKIDEFLNHIKVHSKQTMKDENFTTNSCKIAPDKVVGDFSDFFCGKLVSELPQISDNLKNEHELCNSDTINLNNKSDDAINFDETDKIGEGKKENFNQSGDDLVSQKKTKSKKNNIVFDEDERSKEIYKNCNRWRYTTIKPLPDGKYKCDTCENIYLNREKLICHIKTVHNKKLKCDDCEKYFPSRSKLNLHLNSTHSKEPQYKCNICSKMFRHPHSVIYHRQSVHDEKKREKKVQCELCPIKCHTNYALKVHMLYHNKERPYQCDQCGNRYFNNTELKFHKKNNHENLRELACEFMVDEKICGKRFNSANHLQRHQLIHKEKRYKCDICEAKFINNNKLNCHKKIHDPIPGYICQICSKGFKQRSGLTAHMRTHGIYGKSK